MQRDVLILEQMIDAAEETVALVRDGGVDELRADRQRRDAVLWNLTVLGEAAAQLSPELKDRFPEVAWRHASRLRNRLVHGYWSIDLDVVHSTATNQLPAFSDLRRVLATL